MNHILTQVIQENVMFEITRFYLGVIPLKMAVSCIEIDYSL
jgi:hypothetical protein